MRRTGIGVRETDQGRDRPTIGGDIAIMAKLLKKTALHTAGNVTIRGRDLTVATEEEQETSDEMIATATIDDQGNKIATVAGIVVGTHTGTVALMEANHTMSRPTRNVRGNLQQCRQMLRSSTKTGNKDWLLWRSAIVSRAMQTTRPENDLGNMEINSSSMD